MRQSGIHASGGKVGDPDIDPLSRARSFRVKAAGIDSGRYDDGWSGEIPRIRQGAIIGIRFVKSVNSERGFSEQGISLVNHIRFCPPFFGRIAGSVYVGTPVAMKALFKRRISLQVF